MQNPDSRQWLASLRLFTHPFVIAAVVYIINISLKFAVAPPQICRAQPKKQKTGKRLKIVTGSVFPMPHIFWVIVLNNAANVNKNLSFNLV